MTPLRTRLRCAVCIAGTAALIGPARIAAAQGTVSAQGLGYPPGELSTRALGTGGALGEVDPRSPLNPAALAIGGVAEVYAQYDPEVRTSSGPAGTSSSTISRFPNIGAVIPAGRRAYVGFSATTLLDRTWATSSTQPQHFGVDTVSATQSLRSEGGIEDLRLGVAYEIAPRVRVGIAGHLFTGSNRITAQDRFSDTLRYRNVSQTSDVSYGGHAFSAGIEIDVLRNLAVALDARKGMAMHLYAGDTLLTSANVPDRYGASVSFAGLPGTVVTARAARERWSALAGLSTISGQAGFTQVVDGTDYSLGLESRGPRIGASPILVRLGGRRRTLPFTVSGATVTETSFGGGLGVPVAFDRVTLDLAVLRNGRSGVADVDEHSLTYSIGLRVRP